MQMKIDDVLRLHVAAPPDRQQAGLAAWSAALAGNIGEAADEGYMTLTEVAAKVRKNASWLWRLRVPEICGEQLAGRKMYRLTRVISYLQGIECRRRIDELREAKQRKAR